MQNQPTHPTGSLPKPEGAVRTTSPKTIALVGSTGFLGPHILTYLLKVHPESRIFCINRSADGRQRTLLALSQSGCNEKEHSRLQFLVGNITKPNFGLATEHAALLASKMDELIFNSWDTNWAKPLPHFEPFVNAMKLAVEFCVSAPSHPRITFVSSVCAVADWPLYHGPEEQLVPEEIIQDGKNSVPHGYGQSKFIAEHMLAKAHEESGLRVNIVRAGQIGGPAKLAVRRWPRAQWIYSILRASRKIGWLPTHVTPADWIPVDSLAEGIANCTNRTPKLETVQVFHMVHPQPAAWGLMQDTIQKRYGLRWKMTSLPDWLERSKAQKFRLRGFLTGFQEGREYNMAFANERALEVLPEVPALDEELLAEWLEGWEIEPDELRAKL
jgi:thioester reductase-like protein